MKLFRKTKMIICAVMALVMIGTAIYTKNFQINADATPALVFTQEYAKTGQPLSVQVVNDSRSFTYVWKVGTTTVSGNSTDTYTPKTADLEKFISATATPTTGTGSYTAQLYFSTLPVFYIDTENKAAIVSKIDYINASLKIQGNDEYNSSNTTLYEGLTEIKGRGNSTWTGTQPNGKKPYRLKLDKKTDVFGMTKSRHFYMLSDHAEPSQMKSLVAQEFAKKQSNDFVSSMTTVILILNGVYNGTYQFGEQIRIQKDRVDITGWEDIAEDIAAAICKADKLSPEEEEELSDILKTNLNWMTAKQITYKGKTYSITDYIKADWPDMNDLDNVGGFLGEIDGWYDEISKFRSSMKAPVQFQNPEYMKTNNAYFDNVQKFINGFEAAVQSKDYCAEYNGKMTHYSELFDLTSLVECLIVNEFTMNLDFMSASQKFYKDIGQPAKMGPPWDFHWAFYMDYYNVWAFDRPDSRHEFYQNNYFKNLIKDPLFITRYYEHYKRIRPTVIEDMIKPDGYIDTLIQKLSSAGGANYIKWNNYWAASYAASQKEVKDFVLAKIGWLDKQFTTLENFVKATGHYKPSLKLKITDVSQSDDQVVITAAINNESDIKKIAFFVNGFHAGTVDVTDNTASLEVPASFLIQNKNSMNVAVIRGLDENGEYIIENKAAISNYSTFISDIKFPTTTTTGERTRQPTTGMTLTLSQRYTPLNQEQQFCGILLLEKQCPF